MRSTAFIGAGDRPAPEITVPLVGSKAALDQLAEDALRNPDSPACAYPWVPATITTDGYRLIQEGQTIPVEYRGELRPAVVWETPRIEQTAQQANPPIFRQAFQVRILVV